MMNESPNLRSAPTPKNARNLQTKRKHRRYNLKFKMAAVKLITEQGYTVSEAARRLGIDRTNLKNWLYKHSPNFDPADSAAVMNSDDPVLLRKLLQQQRRENERLRMECDILKKATAYFAKEQL